MAGKLAKVLTGIFQLNAFFVDENFRVENELQNRREAFLKN